ncbi:hypothetical protein [Azospirillum sp. Marseille-Q6669]
MDVLLHRLPPLHRAVLTHGQRFDEETVSEQIMNNKRRVPYLFCSAARPDIDRVSTVRCPCIDP